MNYKRTIKIDFYDRDNNLIKVKIKVKSIPELKEYVDNLSQLLNSTASLFHLK